MGLNQLTESVILSNTHTYIYTHTHCTYREVSKEFQYAKDS